jgi:hypothetical protein
MRINIRIVIHAPSPDENKTEVPCRNISEITEQFAIHTESAKCRVHAAESTIDQS